MTRVPARSAGLRERIITVEWLGFAPDSKVDPSAGCLKARAALPRKTVVSRALLALREDGRTRYHRTAFDML